MNAVHSYEFVCTSAIAIKSCVNQNDCLFCMTMNKYKTYKKHLIDALV